MGATVIAGGLAQPRVLAESARGPTMKMPRLGPEVPVESRHAAVETGYGYMGLSRLEMEAWPIESYLIAVIGRFQTFDFRPAHRFPSKDLRATSSFSLWWIPERGLQVQRSSFAFVNYSNRVSIRGMPCNSKTAPPERSATENRITKKDVSEKTSHDINPSRDDQV
jgi:hypothetical protein